MAKTCKRCGRTKGPPGHVFGLCDQVQLSDGSIVDRKRVEAGGDLHNKMGDDLKVAMRFITPEMRARDAKQRKVSNGI